MANPNETIEQRIKRIRRELDNTSRSFSSATSDIGKAYKAVSKMVQEQYKAIEDSNKNMASLARTQREAAKIGAQSSKEMAKMAKSLEKMQKELDAATARNDKKKMAELTFRMKKEMKETKLLMDYREKRLQEQVQAQDEAFVEARKKIDDLFSSEGAGKAGKAFAESLTSSMSKMKGGDVGGLMSGAAGGAGELAKVMKGLGGKVAMLGKVVGGIGMAFSALTMIVQVLLEADKAAKDLNKSLMQGASALDMFGTNFKRGDLTKNLKDMRDQAYDVGMRFRMSADEVAKLGSVLNQAGLRYDEMGKANAMATDQVDGFGYAVTQVLTKSKMLGVEASTVAEKMAEMNENFAMDLSQISQAFTQIYLAAQTTGMSTQKFYGLITQLTGGMSLLNVDFAQTAAIASELVEALGEAAAGDFLNDLKNRGANQSYTDRIKSAMLEGSRGADIGRKGYSARVKKLGDSSQFAEAIDDRRMKTMLTKMGVAYNPFESLEENMQKMSKNQADMLATALGNTALGGNASLERQMRALIQMREANKMGGPTGRAVQIGQRNMGENLAGFLAESGAFTNLSKGQSLGGMSRLVLEKMSGKSGLQVDQMVTMVDKMNANLRQVQTLAKNVKSEEDLADLAASFLNADGSQMNTRQFQSMLKEQYKLTIDEQGRVMSGDTGEEVKNLKSYLINMGDAMEDLANEGKVMSLENAMTSEIVSNTASITNVLENKIGKTLNSISGGVEAIVSMLGIKSFKRDSKMDEKHIDRLSQEIEKMYEQRTEYQETVAKYGTKVKTGKATERERQMYEQAQRGMSRADALILGKEKERQAVQTFGSDTTRTDKGYVYNVGGYGHAVSRAATHAQKKLIASDAELANRMDPEKIKAHQAELERRELVAAEREQRRDKYVQIMLKDFLWAYSKSGPIGGHTVAPEGDIGMGFNWAEFDTGSGDPATDFEYNKDFMALVHQYLGTDISPREISEAMQEASKGRVRYYNRASGRAGDSGIREVLTNPEYNAAFHKQMEMFQDNPNVLWTTPSTSGYRGAGSAQKYGRNMTYKSEASGGKHIPVFEDFAPDFKPLEMEEVTINEGLEDLKSISNEEFDAIEKVKDATQGSETMLENVATYTKNSGKYMEQDLADDVGDTTVKALVSTEILKAAGQAGVSQKSLVEAMTKANVKDTGQVSALIGQSSKVKKARASDERAYQRAEAHVLAYQAGTTSREPTAAELDTLDMGLEDWIKQHGTSAKYYEITKALGFKAGEWLAGMPPSAMPEPGGKLIMDPRTGESATTLGADNIAVGMNVGGQGGTTVNTGPVSVYLPKGSSQDQAKFFAAALAASGQGKTQFRG